jgi:phage baseplate assembly protein gpV
MIEEIIDAVEHSIEDVKRKFYGVTTGRVINLLDPLTLGRVQVQLPFIDALDLAPWARIAVPFAGPLSGHYFIPNIGDQVLVAFEHGDVNAPYVLGSLWSAMAPPPLPSPLPQIRAMRTLAGNQIVMTEVPPSITIQNAPTPPSALPAPPSPTGPHCTVMLSPVGVQVMSPTMVTVQVAATTLLVTPEGITMTASGNVVSLSPAGVTISASGALTISSAGPCTITAPLVKIN